MRGFEGSPALDSAPHRSGRGFGEDWTKAIDVRRPAFALRRPGARVSGVSKRHSALATLAGVYRIGVSVDVALRTMVVVPRRARCHRTHHREGGAQVICDL